MQKKLWLILAVCLALLAAVFLLLPKNSPTEQPAELGKSAKTEANLVETPQSGDLERETFGGLTMNMTMAEVEAILGKPELATDGEEIRWSYESLNIAFHSFNERVSEIRALTGCSFTLNSGISLGSTREEVIKAYPLAFESGGDLDIDKVNSWIYVDDPDCGLQIGVTNGVVSEIIWKDYSNPLLEALTVNEITLYTADNEAVRVIDKAAKRICTTMTISEPEAAPLPKSAPIGWMDFGNGTAVCLYEGDYAVVFRYEGTFAPIVTASTHLEGIFFGLGGAFAQALESPTETW